MAQRRHLGPHLLADDKISINQLFSAFGLRSYTYLLGRMKKAGLRVRYHKTNSIRFRVVDLEEFWNFIEKNRTMLDFSKLEKNALGREPDWVESARREDDKLRVSLKPRRSRWTKSEDAELLRLVRGQKYSYAEIAQLMRRSCGAISRRLYDLNAKERPVKADNHVKWSSDELKILGKMIKLGSNYENIGKALGKSSKAIRGMVFSSYLTEDLDRVRMMMNGGEWGDNRPTRQLKHKNLMPAKEKREMSEGLNRLVCLLTYHAKQIAR